LTSEEEEEERHEPPPKRKKKANKSHEDRIIGILQDTSHAIKNFTSEEDENDIFGKSIASFLKRLPSDIRIMAREEITKVIWKCQRMELASNRQAPATPPRRFVRPWNSSPQRATQSTSEGAVRVLSP